MIAYFYEFSGNTRVIGQEQLQKFQKNMGKAVKDPFQVVMRQTKLPVSLLSEKSKVGDFTENQMFIGGKIGSEIKEKRNMRIVIDCNVRVFLEKNNLLQNT